jgi:phosphatidate cytidylyltransferase
MSLVIILLAIHFLLGGIGIILINLKCDSEKRRANRIKYFVYLVLSALIISAVYSDKVFFVGLSIIIFSASLFEILKTGSEKGSGTSSKSHFVKALMILIIAAVLFSLFILLPTNIIISTYITVIIFDGASQIVGQLFGKRKILPVLSPGKTVEGVAGGTIIAVATTVILSGYAGLSVIQSLGAGLLVCAAAFSGDAAASAFKRAFNVKDFGTILPGQGGVLDRYDSFIASGAMIGLISLPFFPALSETGKNLAAYMGFSLTYIIILLSAEIIYTIFRIRSEYTRMFSHILTGIVCLFMPQLFSSGWYTVALCLQSALFLYLTKRLGIIDSHNKVERKTYGSSFFFLGLLASFLISEYRGDVSVFYLSLLILTISDPLAALIGLDSNRYYWPAIGRSWNSAKTFTGSSAFFVSAFFILASGFKCIYNFSNADCFIFSALIAGLSMIAEAISFNGTDNITVPVVVSVLTALII